VFEVSVTGAGFVVDVVVVDSDLVVVVVFDVVVVFSVEGNAEMYFDFVFRKVYKIDQFYTNIFLLNIYLHLKKDVSFIIYS